MGLHKPGWGRLSDSRLESTQFPIGFASVALFDSRLVVRMLPVLPFASSSAHANVQYDFTSENLLRSVRKTDGKIASMLR